MSLLETIADMLTELEKSRPPDYVVGIVVTRLCPQDKYMRAVSKKDGQPYLLINPYHYSEILKMAYHVPVTNAFGLSGMLPIYEDDRMAYEILYGETIQDFLSDWRIEPKLDFQTELERLYRPKLTGGLL